MFQAIGGYLDAFVLIGCGLAARLTAPRFVKPGTPPEQAERQVARTRLIGVWLLVGGIGLLVMHLLGI